MHTYAYIADGAVREIIEPLAGSDGQEIPIESRFTPEFVAALVDITSINPAPVVGDVYDASVFSAAPIAPITWGFYQDQARALLDQSDVTMVRCVENSVAVPASWSTYRKALRAIVSSATGDPSQPLPTRPAFPSGT